jgi:hypothetical protein
VFYACKSFISPRLTKFRKEMERKMEQIKEKIAKKKI